VKAWYGGGPSAIAAATRRWWASRASESMFSNDGCCLYVFVVDGGRVCGITLVA
jgi:hypothetical protein